MTPEQSEVTAKLKEIEEQTQRLLDEMAVMPGLTRTRILHIQHLSRYLRGVIGTKLTLVSKGDRD